MTNNDILIYATRLNVYLTIADCEEIRGRAQADGIKDCRAAVWDYLDEFEGIAHSRDQDYWGIES